MKKKTKRPRNENIPAQLFKIKDGKVIPGRKFVPYTVWGRPKTPERRRLYQELELFLLQNPGMRAPVKEIMTKSGVKNANMDVLTANMRRRHNLPRRLNGSTLPIKVQNEIAKAVQHAKKRKKIEVLEAIYAVYKTNGGLVISFDAAWKLLKQQIKADSEKMKIGTSGTSKIDNIGILRQKMKQLELMEKKGKLPWKIK